MDVVTAFPADAHTAEVVKPGDRALDDVAKMPRPVPWGLPRFAITGRIPRARG